MGSVSSIFIFSFLACIYSSSSGFSASPDTLIYLETLSASLHNLANSDPSPRASIWHKKLSCADEGIHERSLRLLISRNITALATALLPRQDMECSIAFIPGSIEDRGVFSSLNLTDRFEGVFVEDTSVVRFSEALPEGVFHFDRNEYSEKSMRVLAEKRKLLSVIFPTWTAVERDRSGRLLEKFRRYNVPEFSDHIYFQDPISGLVPEGVFLDYHFCYIVQPLEQYSEYLPRIYLQALENHCVPITETESSEYFRAFGIKTEASTWRQAQVISPNLEDTVAFLSSLLTANQTSQFGKMNLSRFVNFRVTQDILLMKYNLPAEERLRVAACNVCLLRRNRQPAASLAPEILSGGSLSLFRGRQPGMRPTGGGSNETGVWVFLAIVTTPGNFELRMAARRTWLKLLGSRGGEYRFFVCGNLSEISAEAERFGDIVMLDCEEEYKKLQLKLFAIYEWMIGNVKHASFYFRLDDDVYVRPGPVFEMLRRRTPSRYWWGSFAHLSGVVRNETNVKEFCTKEEYPLGELYPLYPRGPFNVMSWDLIRLIVENKYSLHRIMPMDDVAVGIYLFQLYMRRRIHLVIDDRDETRFAFTPACSNVFNGLKNTTWVVHHVTPQQIDCMWAVDVLEGVYLETEDKALIKQHRYERWPDLCPCASENS